MSRLPFATEAGESSDNEARRHERSLAREVAGTALELEKDDDRTSTQPLRITGLGHTFEVPSEHTRLGLLCILLYLGLLGGIAFGLMYMGRGAADVIVPLLTR